MYSSFSEAGLFSAGWWQTPPPGLVALGVLLLGAIVALLVRLLAARVLEAVGFNRLCDRVGVTELLRKGAVGYSPSRLAASTAEWVVLLAAVLWGLHLLGMHVISAWLAQLGGSLPSLLTAISIAILGYAAVAFLANVVRTIARNAASPNAELLARVTKWGGAVVVAWVAVDQLGIEIRFISSILLILVAATAFGLVLAFGLGCKDMAREAMQKLLRDLRERRQQPPTDLEG